MFTKPLFKYKVVLTPTSKTKKLIDYSYDYCKTYILKNNNKKTSVLAN